MFELVLCTLGIAMFPLAAGLLWDRLAAIFSALAQGIRNFRPERAAREPTEPMGSERLEIGGNAECFTGTRV